MVPTRWSIGTAAGEGGAGRGGRGRPKPGRQRVGVSGRKPRARAQAGHAAQHRAAREADGGGPICSDTDPRARSGVTLQ